jgi:hypothetical protein
MCVPAEYFFGGRQKQIIQLYLYMEQGPPQNQAQTLRIAPRSKRIDGVVHVSGVVVLSLSNLERHFSSPLHVAAKDLGVCITALKW